MSAMTDPAPSALAAAERLVAALRDPVRYPHPVAEVEVVETHISWVLLAGDFAYKLKKPVDLGFLDYTRLADRKRCCEEELRLNRRTAPQLYLGVAAIAGTPDAPVVDADPAGGDAIEYAVKMRRFPQDALLDRVARRGELTAALVDRVAADVARFHDGIARAPAGAEWGTPDQVAVPVEQNFAQIEALVEAPADFEHLETLRTWTHWELGRRHSVLLERRRDGFVRECHGDLHLANIALVDGAPVAFDGIEFDAALRWIDVMNETAFLVMDLLDHGLEPLAWRCLSAYLEATGDYDAVAVLRLYLVYRALVRAKIACIRAHQPGVAIAGRIALDREYHGYFELARRLSQGAHPAIVLMHGLSGSGKTTVAQSLVETIGGVRVRSDIERKRLLGLGAGVRTHAGVGSGPYSQESDRRTYARLQSCARAIVDGGFPAIVDAAFLRRADRDAFRALAAELGVPFVIASCDAEEDVLRERVAARERSSADASEATVAVLERQLETQEPLGADEYEGAVVFDTEGGEDSTRAATLRLGARLALAALAAP